MLDLLLQLAWRFAPPRYTFNPDAGLVLRMTTNPIVFIHVGKCAGASVRTALLPILPRGHTLHEMHCYDANRRIAAAVDQDDGRIEHLICARDPVERFVSAFNWDKHNLYLRGYLAGTREGSGYARFATIDALARGLRSRDDAERQAATDLATSERLHMGMGQSWYTPLQVIERLPVERTTVIFSDAVRSGLLQFAGRCGCRRPGPTWAVPRENSNYRLAYPDHEAIFPTRLSQAEGSAIRDCITHDMGAYHALLARHSVPDSQPDVN